MASYTPPLSRSVLFDWTLPETCADIAAVVGVVVAIAASILHLPFVFAGVGLFAFSLLASFTFYQIGEYSKELEKTADVVDQLRRDNASLSAQMEQNNQSSQRTLENTRTRHEQELAQLSSRKDRERDELQQKMDNLRIDKDATIDGLRQQIKTLEFASKNQSAPLRAALENFHKNTPVLREMLRQNGLHTSLGAFNTAAQKLSNLLESTKEIADSPRALTDRAQEIVSQFTALITPLQDALGQLNFLQKEVETLRKPKEATASTSVTSRLFDAIGLGSKPANASTNSVDETPYPHDGEFV